VIDDSLETTWLSHRFRAVVTMCSGAVPVAGHRLRVESDDDSEVLGNAMKQEASHPQVIAHFDTFARSNLELNEHLRCDG